jgi:hypothetical protein
MTRALDKEALSAACRTIYEMAGQDYLLPTATSESDAGSTSRLVHMLSFSVESRQFCLIVSEDDCDAHDASPTARLPIKFRAELSDADDPACVVELAGAEKSELVRAFLLGAKAPIILERDARKAKTSFFLQLSSTRRVAIGFLSAGAGASDDTCDRISAALYRLSAGLFANRSQGLDVWRIRVAQSLLDAGRLPAGAFWPAMQRTPRPSSIKAPPPLPTRTSSFLPRYAIAAPVAVGIVALSVVGAVVNFQVIANALSVDTPSVESRIATALTEPRLHAAMAQRRIQDQVPDIAPASFSPDRDYDAPSMAVEDTTPPPIMIGMTPSSPSVSEREAAASLMAVSPYPGPALLMDGNFSPLIMAKQTLDLSSQPTNVAARKAPRTKVAAVKRPKEPKTLARSAAEGIATLAKNIGQIPYKVALLFKR